jgi:hypothetical protein
MSGMGFALITSSASKSRMTESILRDESVAGAFSAEIIRQILYPVCQLSLGLEASRERVIVFEQLSSVSVGRFELFFIPSQLVAYFKSAWFQQSYGFGYRDHGSLL